MNADALDTDTVDVEAMLARTGPAGGVAPGVVITGASVARTFFARTGLASANVAQPQPRWLQKSLGYIASLAVT